LIAPLSNATVAAAQPWLGLTLPSRHPADRGWVKAQAGDALSTVFPYRTESQIARPDGTLRHIVSSGQPEYDAAGKLVALVEMCQDVTAAKEAARDRERLLARVNLATRAARVGIWDWDIVTGEIDWDAMMFELYGLESDDCAPVYEVWAQSMHVDDRFRVSREKCCSRRVRTSWRGRRPGRAPRG